MRVRPKIMLIAAIVAAVAVACASGETATPQPGSGRTAGTTGAVEPAVLPTTPAEITPGTPTLNVTPRSAPTPPTTTPAPDERLSATPAPAPTPPPGREAPDLTATPATPSGPVVSPVSPTPTVTLPPVGAPTPALPAPTATPAPVAPSVPTPSPAPAVQPTPFPRSAPTPPPPDSFDTPEAALARAAELGCSGYRGGAGYLPCASADQYTALISGGPFNLSGAACRLESNPGVRFTAPVTDIDKISLIIPSGSANGGVIKPHSYIHPATIYGVRINSSIYAPADSWLQSIAYYTTSLGTNEYLLTFFASCEVAYRLDHILSPVASILAVAPKTPATTSHTTDLAEPIFFKAGELVAHSRGAGDGAGPWDFGAYNTTVVNTFANQDRYSSATNTGQSINAVCPYDLYDEPLRSQFHALFGGNSGPGYPDAPCPAGRDVAGAVAGAWFAPEGASDGSGFAITLEGDDGVMMTAAGLDVRVPKGAPTWADPATVTTSHCYDGGSRGWAFLELLDANTLAVAGGTGGCPGSLPATYSTFVR